MATSDSYEIENGIVHSPDKALDGDTNTRWCAADGTLGHWWEVDLGAKYDLTGIEIVWEFAKTYRYQVEGSTDDTSWFVILDKSANTDSNQTQDDTLTARSVRYVRVVVTTFPDNATWFSIWECRVFGTLSDWSPPASPSNLTPVGVSSTQINLTWTDNASNETGFRIERAFSALGPWSQIGMTASNITSYADTNLSPSTIYFYRVRATNAAGDSGYSGIGNADTQGINASPPTPVNLALNEDASTDTFEISNGLARSADKGNDGDGGTRFCAVDGAAGHWWKVDLGSAYDLASIQIVWEFAKAYSYRVEASADNANWSTILDKTGNTNSSQTQTEPLSARSVRYVRVVVTAFPDGWTWFSMWECRIFGSISYATPPANPGNLSAGAASSSQINLTWTDNAVNAMGFQIERSSSPTGPWTPIATTGTGITSYSDTSVDPSSTYFYRVSASNTAGNSGYSNVDGSTTPSNNAPDSTLVNIALNKAATSDTFEISNGLARSADKGNDGDGGTRFCAVDAATGHWWKVDLGSAYDLASIQIVWEFAKAYGYRVEASADNANWSTVLDKTGNTNTSQTQTETLSARSVRYVRVVVTAFPDGWTWFSMWECRIFGTISPPAAPAAPTDLAAGATSSSQINLIWTDNADTETGFRIERALSSSGPWTQIAITSSRVTSYSDSGLSASSVYCYRVRATNSSGDSSYSNQAIASTLTVVTSTPAAPSNLAATGASSDQINLSWSDNSDNEVGFIIERATSPVGSWTPIATASANVTTYSDLDGLVANTTYYYRVSAFN